jgi:hypothetical protein
VNKQRVNSAPGKGESGGKTDKYSIRGSGRETIVQKREETDKDGKAAVREGNTKSDPEGVRRGKWRLVRDS